MKRPRFHPWRGPLGHMCAALALATPATLRRARAVPPKAATRKARSGACAALLFFFALACALGMFTPAPALAQQAPGAAVQSDGQGPAQPGSQTSPPVTKVIIVGGDRDYPPYEFLDKNGEPVGYNVDLTRAIAEVMGFRVEFRLGAWAHVRTALADGGVDILQGMSYSEERLGEVEFTPPHTIVNHAVFARNGTPPVSTLEDLRGKSLVMHRGGIMHDTLRSMGFDEELNFSETPADALRMVSAGRYDYAVTAMLPGLYIIRENSLRNLEPVAKSVLTVRYGYAVKKGNTELLGRFSEGLAILDETGKYEQIRHKWLGVLEPRPLRWETAVRYIALIVVPMVAMLAAAVLWSHSLRRQVAQRTRSLSDALEALHRNQQQLVQADKMAALGTLVSGVAHEINNPTGTILLNLPLLKRAQADTLRILDEHLRDSGPFKLGGIPYERMRRELPAMLEEMQEGAQRIKRIVNDLKDFARRDEPRETELVDVNLAVRKAARLLDSAIRKSTGRFALHLAEDLPPVRGSAQRLEQVLINLLLNACQSLPDMDRGVSVMTRHDRQAHTVEILVIDQGRGIAPDHLPHLTDPFFTTKRDQGGTGLGLSVSAGLVKELGGTMEFHSVPQTTPDAPCGTTVTLRLPAATEHPA